VEQTIAAGVFRAGNPQAIADAIWAQFHGIVTLANGMSSFFTKERAHNAAEQVFAMMFEGLKPLRLNFFTRH
jgi:hypothetical protein